MGKAGIEEREGREMGSIPEFCLVWIRCGVKVGKVRPEGKGRLGGRQLLGGPVCRTQDFCCNTLSVQRPIHSGSSGKKGDMAGFVF